MAQTSTPLSLKSGSLKIGTRGSPLALAQAHEVRDRLLAANPDLLTADTLDVVTIKTTGDLVLDRPLADIGGKGLFSKEIDRALLDQRVDLAVHSTKDLETWMPDGIAFAGVLEREDPRDALIGDGLTSVDSLPRGAVVGTSSIRRQAQLLHQRPDLKVTLFRGNVQTRLKKLADGAADATLLAYAGLRRLGRAEVASHVLDPSEMLPSVAQGAIGLTCRADDEAALGLIATITDENSTRRVTAERAMLEALDGSCRTPIAGLAELDGAGGLWLRGLVAAPDGSRLHAGERRGAADDAQTLGLDLGQELKALAGPDLFGTSED